MKIRELLEAGEAGTMQPPGSDMGAPMASINPMATSMPSGGGSATMPAGGGPMAQSNAPMQPSGQTGQVAPFSGAPNPASNPAAPMKTAGLGSDIMNYFMSGPKPAYQGAPTPTQSIQSGPSAAGQALGNAVTGGALNKATGAMSQPSPKPNQ